MKGGTRVAEGQEDGGACSDQLEGHLVAVDRILGTGRLVAVAAAAGAAPGSGTGRYGNPASPAKEHTPPGIAVEPSSSSREAVVAVVGTRWGGGVGDERCSRASRTRRDQPEGCTASGEAEEEELMKSSRRRMARPGRVVEGRGGTLTPSWAYVPTSERSAAYTTVGNEKNDSSQRSGPFESLAFARRERDRRKGSRRPQHRRRRSRKPEEGSQPSKERREEEARASRKSQLCLLFISSRQPEENRRMSTTANGEEALQMERERYKSDKSEPVSPATSSSFLPPRCDSSAPCPPAPTPPSNREPPQS